MNQKSIITFRKILCILTLAVVMITSMVTTASAATTNMSKHTISAGAKMTYWSGTNYCALPKGKVLTTKAIFSKKVTSAAGVRVYSGSSYTDTISPNIYDSGIINMYTSKNNVNCRAIIQNKQSTTITVNSGSLSF